MANFMFQNLDCFKFYHFYSRNCPSLCPDRFYSIELSFFFTTKKDEGLWSKNQREWLQVELPYNPLPQLLPAPLSWVGIKWFPGTIFSFLPLWILGVMLMATGGRGGNWTREEENFAQFLPCRSPTLTPPPPSRNTDGTEKPFLPCWVLPCTSNMSEFCKWMEICMRAKFFFLHTVATKSSFAMCRNNFRNPTAAAIVCKFLSAWFCPWPMAE